MKKIIKRIFNKVPKKVIDNRDMDILCNNPPTELNSFCSLEFAYMNKRN